MNKTIKKNKEVVVEHDDDYTIMFSIPVCYAVIKGKKFMDDEIMREDFEYKLKIAKKAIEQS